MTTKRVEVASTDYRLFVQKILELGALGGKLPEDAGVFKGVVLRTQIEIDEDILIDDHNLYVLPQERKPEVKSEDKEEDKPAKGRKANKAE